MKTAEQIVAEIEKNMASQRELEALFRTSGSEILAQTCEISARYLECLLEWIKAEGDEQETE